MRLVLEGLGYEVQAFPGTAASHLSLATIRRAIDEDNPVIVAVDVRRYTASLGRTSSVPSHYILVYGYTTDYHGADGDVEGYVYALDPGYMNGRRLRITFDEFNAAINSNATGTTEPSGLIVTRPGFLRLPNSTWYPPGTLLRIDGEYYYVGLPDPSGVVVGSLLRIWHASPEALRAQRIPTDRAITVSFNIVGCFQFMGEMNTARHFREYREPGGAIYLVDTNTRERMVFLNEDAYRSHNGSDEWMSTTEAEQREWSRYRLSGDLGLSPGTLVRSPGSSTVWVVSVNGSGRVRLPIFNERTADIFGYPIDRLEEVNPRLWAFVPEHDLDRVAGRLGETLREELARDCRADYCLTAASCYEHADVGGGEAEASAGEHDGLDPDVTPDFSAPPPDAGMPMPPPDPDAGVSPTPECSVDRDCPAYGSGWRCRSGSCRETDIDGDGVLGSDGDCNIEVARIHRGAVESCDYVDEDCDGRIDETFDFSSDPRNCGSCGRSCGSGEICTAGTCVTPCSASSEVCGDGIDNNCDGRVDEGCAPVCTPVAEVCDGRDQDCDGRIDEGVTPIACSTACGSGTRSCVGGSFGSCSARVPSTETCNGLDDDCDGTVDDGVCASPTVDPNLVRIRLTDARAECAAGWRIRLWLGPSPEESARGEALERVVPPRGGHSAITLRCDERSPPWQAFEPADGHALGSGIFSELSLGGVDLRSSIMLCTDPCNPSGGTVPIIMWDPARRGTCPTSC
jgi:hypothetical protein